MEQGYANLTRVTVGSVLPKAAVSTTCIPFIQPSMPLIPPLIQKDLYYISTFYSVHQVSKRTIGKLGGALPSSLHPLLISGRVSFQLSSSCQWFGMDKSPSLSYTSSIRKFDFPADRYDNTLLTRGISPS